MKFLLFDTETTGLVKHPTAKMEVQPKIIEFGAALVDRTGKILEEMNVIVDPQEPLEAIITKITGLTDEDLKGEPTFDEVAPRIMALFAQADVMIAHNLPFDSTLIELECLRHEIKGWPWPPHSLCTVQEHAEEWGWRPKLTTLYEDTFDEPLAQTHRALDDVKAMLEMCIHRGILHDFPAAPNTD